MNAHTYSTYTERAEALSRSFGGAGRAGADLPMEQIEPLAAWNTLPESTLLLGFGEENVTLMLDLHSPAAGSLLVAGDRGCGKTSLLRMLALQTETIPTQRNTRPAAVVDALLSVAVLCRIAEQACVRQAHSIQTTFRISISNP